MPERHHRRPDTSAETRKEFEAHIGISAEDKVSNGVSRDEALRAAEESFGDRGKWERECQSSDGRRARATNRAAFLAAAIQDLRIAFRSLRRSPGFAITAVLTLALGIGVNTSIFSVVNAVLLQPLPFENPRDLVQVWGHHPEVGLESSSGPDFLDYRSQSKSFSAMIGYFRSGFTLDSDGQASRVLGAVISDGLMSLLGTTPIIGRDIQPGDVGPGGDRVAVLSNGLWQRSFGGDPSVLGSTISLDGEPYEIVGVAPEGFRFPDAEFWTPITDSLDSTGRRSDFIRIVARLAPGASISSAQTELTQIADRLEDAYPASNDGWTARKIQLPL